MDKSKYMTRVPYLEDTDFNQDNSLKAHVGNGKPTVVMAQGVFCGYCSTAKPAFQQFTHTNKNVNGVTIQIDGQPSEKKAGERIKKLDPTYRGVPVYLGFNSEGKFVKVHSGGRDFQSLNTFANSL
jgi:thiol-disulfide isomerase/thioredoxin